MEIKKKEQEFSKIMKKYYISIKDFDTICCLLEYHNISVMIDNFGLDVQKLLYEELKQKFDNENGIKEKVLEFKKELNKLSYQTSKEDYIISIIKIKDKFKQIFGDLENET
jgi:hypothetical protein